MCGIAGIVLCRGSGLTGREAEKTIVSMTETLVSRGPDDKGHVVLGESEHDTHTRPVVALGHRRLSIVAPQAGRQPLCNEDRSVWAVCNGEIYNHRKLREELESGGHIFRTKSDTEPVVHLYEDEESAFSPYPLRGMFAIALWDERKRRLVLARDRLGQKPLYYWNDSEKGIFAFASELKAIRTVPGFVPVVSRRALYYYLKYQYVPYPECVLKNVKKLQPGHLLIYRPEDSSVKLSPYWEIPEVVDKGISVKEARERLKSTLLEAVDIRMQGAYPAGAFLSGGLDSSITVALMSSISEEPVKTFSIGFKDRRFNEEKYASRVADYFNTDHNASVLGSDSIDIIQDVAGYLDEPFGDSSIIPTFLLSRLASEKVKVVLGGDGADEAFAGYCRYAAALLGEKWDRVPQFIRNIAWQQIPAIMRGAKKERTLPGRIKKMLNGLGLSAGDRYINWMSIFNSEDLGKLLDFECRGITDRGFIEECYDRVKGADFVHRTTIVDMLSYLPCDILTKIDRASMANGLEVRSPFLDHKVIELAASLPLAYKLRFTPRGLEGKRILKEAFKDVLPGFVLRRGKKGFGLPLDRWFRKEMKNMMQDILLSRKSLERGYFSPQAIKKLVKEHVCEVENHAFRLWSLLMLELWHRNFADRT